MSKAIQKLQCTSEITKKNLTEAEAADQYGMSVHWYRRSRWKGDGPRFIKLSGAVLYPVSELEAYFNSRLTKSTSDSERRKPSPARGI